MKPARLAAAALAALLLAVLSPSPAPALPQEPAPQASGDAKADLPLVPDQRSAPVAVIPPSDQEVVPPLVLKGRVQLAPYLEILVDPTATLDAEEAASPQNAPKYQIYDPERLPAEGGVSWLRFVLPPNASSSLVLDLGPSVPHGPVLQHQEITREGQIEWEESAPSRGAILLPRTGPEPLVCFLRVDGLPGVWFSPSVRTLADAVADGSDVWPWAALTALAVTLVACLLSALCRPGQWRVWALLFLAAAMAKSWAGLPAIGAAYDARTLSALCAGGIALMLWPLAGRHLLRAQRTSRALDVQLILLCLPGAAAALLPLVPNFGWTVRYTELWPAAMIIFLPTALWACMTGAPGCARFLMGSLLPPAATAAGVLGLKFGFDAGLLASLPAFGVALGVLLALAGSGRGEAAPAPAAPAAGGLPAGIELPREEPVVLVEPAPEEPRDPYERMAKPLEDFERSYREATKRPEFPLSCVEPAGSLLAAALALAGRIREAGRLAAQEIEDAKRLQVICVSRDPAFKAVLAHVLGRDGCKVREAGSFEEAAALAEKRPALFHVFEGEFAHRDASPLLSDLRKICAAAGTAAPIFLAYTPDDSTWRSLGRAGFTHALTLPIDDEALSNTLRELREERAKARRAVQDAPKPSEDEERHEIPDLFGPAPASAPAAPAVQDAPSAGGTAEERPGRPKKAPDDAFVLLGDPVGAPGPEPKPEPDARGELRSMLLLCVRQAKAALLLGDWADVAAQAGEIAAKAADERAVAGMADLVAKAARIPDGKAASEFLSQLADTIERAYADREPRQ